MRRSDGGDFVSVGEDAGDRAPARRSNATDEKGRPATSGVRRCAPAGFPAPAARWVANAIRELRWDIDALGLAVPSVAGLRAPINPGAGKGLAGLLRGRDDRAAAVLEEWLDARADA